MTAEPRPWRATPVCWRVITLACCCALWLCAGRAHADDSERARSAFVRGVAASEAAAWPQARADFLESQALAPKASTLFNLALSEVKLGLYAEAWGSLNAFDALAQPDIHQSLIDRAHALRRDIEAVQTRARIADLESSLRQQASENGAPRATPPPVSAPSLRLGRALVGSGAGFLLSAVGTGLWWHNRADNLDRCHRSGGVTCHELTQITQQTRAATSLTLSLGIGALGLITSGAIWLATRQHRATPAVVASPGALVFAF